MFQIPQFEIVFTLPQYEANRVTYGARQVTWIINGEEDLDVVAKVLRWNGVKSYEVRPHDVDGVA